MTKPPLTSLAEDFAALGIGPKGPVGPVGPSGPPTLGIGDLVVFRPPLPRCQYQGGVFLGIKEDISGPTCCVRLPSGLEIAVKVDSIKKAGWLESLALQAEQ